MQTFPPQPGNKELAAAIKELSRLKYGRPRNIVTAEIMDRAQLGTSKTSTIEMTEPSL
jgi:hypothetical protein